MILAPLLAALALQIGIPQNPADRSGYDTNLRNLENQQNAKGPPQPVFLKTPTVEDLTKVYPPDALAKNISGEVTIHCTVDKTGSFTKCKVMSETPKKAGFGDAALQLAQVFKLDTKASDGSSMVGQGLTMPLKFSPP